MPQTLDGIHDLLQLETHCIRVAGRERQDKFREIHQFGQLHYIEDEQVEETITEIIQRFMRKQDSECSQTMSPAGSPLILAGFSLDFEFRILSSLYPGLLSLFTSWLDLQEVAKELSTDGTGRVISPGLHETLLACGFENGPNGSQSKRSQHNAATDTVRAPAIFT